MWHSEGPMKMSPNLTSYQMGWTISERFPPSSCGSWSAENICFAFFSHLAWVFFFFPPVDSHYIKISEFSWISISENKQGEFFFFFLSHVVRWHLYNFSFVVGQTCRKRQKTWHRLLSKNPETGPFAVHPGYEVGGTSQDGWSLFNSESSHSG